MTHQLTITEQPGYLHFRVTGENTLQTVRAYLAEIHAECARRGCSAILMEEDLSGPGLGILDLFQIIEGGGDSARSLLKRIACVDVHSQSRSGNARFTETVARNRGLNLRAFPTIEAAAEWLNQFARPPKD